MIKLWHLMFAAILVVVFGHISGSAQAQDSSAPEKASEKTIVDTDIGGDVDAVALALRSPELKILGFTTLTSDTQTRSEVDSCESQSDIHDHG